jgi:hypothetical protein
VLHARMASSSISCTSVVRRLISALRCS